MKRSIALAFVLASSMLSGCQLIYGSAGDFAELSLGMTRAEVVKILGKPIAVSADEDKQEMSLIYKRMKHFFSEYPRTFEVVLRSGKVVRYGEQYNERNINRF